MSSLLRTATIQIFLKFISHSYVSLSFLLLWNSYTPVDRSKTIPDPRPKWTKCIPVFRPKRRKNPTPWGGTHYMAYIKEYPPGILIFVLHRGYSVDSYSVNLLWTRSLSKNSKMNITRLLCTILLRWLFFCKSGSENLNFLNN